MRRQQERMDTSDEALIQACRAGDSIAWDSLFKKYRQLVFYIPLKYGLTQEDAADIAQHTFTVLLQSLDTLRDSRALGTWLSTVAERQTWRQLQRYKRESTREDKDVAEQLDTLVPREENNNIQRERIEWLNQGLAQLNEKCRQLLVALYFDWEQPSYEHIAQRFKLRLGSIGPTRARCLEQLKKLLPDL